MILLLALSFHAHAQTLFDDEKKIAAWLQENKVPAVGIGIIRDGKLKQVKVYGELQKGVAAPYDTIFNVASLTKPVVVILTLKLVSEGKWKLDEPLATYWVDPDIAGDPRHATLTTRHVLSHQTGFLNWRWLDESKKLIFHADPGTKFGYSGEGFEYLRKALEQKFGKPLAELSEQYVFGPAGMRDTQHAWSERTDESRFARWHDKEGKHAYPDHRTDANAADDLLTTVEDYGRFGAYVLGGAGLSEAVFNDMVKVQSTMRPKVFMGLGWEIHKDFPNGEYALIHSGSDQGVNAVLILLPKSKQGLLVITNSDAGFMLYEKLVVESLDLGKELMARAKS